MPGIARDEVVRIAALARLSMDETEIDRMQRDLASVLSFASARAAALEPTLHAFVRLRADAARAEAHESDARRARGEVRSPLDGIPVAIKDNLVRSGEPTTCASRILEGFVSPYDATAVAKLVA